MANSVAWKNFEEIKQIFNRVAWLINEAKIVAQEFERIKKEVLDDPESRAELKKILDQHPNWGVEYLVEQYQRYKSLYDYLIENEYI